jgi:type I restriction enzyme S subunit
MIVRRTVQAKLKRYRASVLKVACEGRLVATEAELARKEGRSYEIGQQLLARILKERRAKWEANQLARMQAVDRTTMVTGRRNTRSPIRPTLSS